MEGVVAKRRDSLYELGLRTGAWVQMRVNRGQEFVIGGYIVVDLPFAVGTIERVPKYEPLPVAHLS